MHAFIWAVSRALTKLGMAIANIMGMTNMAKAIPRSPVTRRAMAKPCPVRVPLERLMRDSALCPQMTPGMAAKIEKQTRLKIPRTMLQIARAEVLGEGGLPPIGGIVSLMRHLCGRVVKVNQQVYLPGLKCSQPILSFTT